MVMMENIQYRNIFTDEILIPSDIPTVIIDDLSFSFFIRSVLVV